MTLNRELLRKRLEEIETNLSLIEQAAHLSLDEFVNLPDKAEATMFRLLICIEAAQAVCLHLAARVSSQTPDSPAECFLCLAEAGVYEKELAVRLGEMCRFRNMLVHRYWKVDLAQVHGFLLAGVADLKQYCVCISRYGGSA